MSASSRITENSAWEIGTRPWSRGGGPSLPIIACTPATTTTWGHVRWGRSSSVLTSELLQGIVAALHRGALVGAVHRLHQGLQSRPYRGRTP